MYETDNKSLKRYFESYLQPAFVICVVILAVAGSGMSLAIKQLGLVLKKEPIALKKSLDFMDEQGLGPFKVVSKHKIENKEVIESLGTEDYIQWWLEDTDTAPDSAVRSCMLFITYYGRPDVVVHIPEECYMGGGNQRLSTENVIFYVGNPGVESKSAKGDRPSVQIQKIPGRYLMFGAAKSGLFGSQDRFPILYIFNVNGRYKGTRETARLELNKNLYGRHSYFSKVEWQFFGTRFGSKVYPDKTEAIAASEKMLAVILPVLEKEFWPDLDS